MDDSIKVGCVVTSMSDICNEFRDTAQVGHCHELFTFPISQAESH